MATEGYLQNKVRELNEKLDSLQEDIDKKETRLREFDKRFGDLLRVLATVEITKKYVDELIISQRKDIIEQIESHFEREGRVREAVMKAIIKPAVVGLNEEIINLRTGQDILQAFVFKDRTDTETYRRFVKDHFDKIRNKVAELHRPLKLGFSEL